MIRKVHFIPRKVQPLTSGLFVILCFFLSSIQMMGCGSSSEGLTEQKLQIFKVGQNTPIEELRPVYPNEEVFLEARISGQNTSVLWWSADSSMGEFVSEGHLKLKSLGSFMIGAISGENRVYILVTVIEKEATAPTPPQPQPSTGFEHPPSVPSDPYIDEVVSFHPGPGAGFGSNEFPQIVLGAPHGSGANVGSFDVLSLGAGGFIVLKSVTPILNLAGPDFIVFENAFYAGGNPLTPFAEPAEVSVSSDGVDFHPFPCAFDQPENFYPGCAGVHPVYANPDLNLINPLNPLTAGGEAYDLEDLAIQWIYYIKIEDKSTSGGGSSAGFDLDAVSIIHQ